MAVTDHDREAALKAVANLERTLQALRAILAPGTVAWDLATTHGSVAYSQAAHLKTTIDIAATQQTPAR